MTTLMMLLPVIHTVWYLHCLVYVSCFRFTMTITIDCPSTFLLISAYGLHVCWYMYTHITDLRMTAYDHCWQSVYDISPRFDIRLYHYLLSFFSITANTLCFVKVFMNSFENLPMSLDNLPFKLVQQVTNCTYYRESNSWPLSSGRPHASLSVIQEYITTGKKRFIYDYYIMW
jgi:hypothetical protein